MDRRTFLVRLGGTLVAVPMVLEAVACGSSSTKANSTTSWPETSSTNGGHSHTLTLLCADLAKNSVQYRTSNNGHDHTVNLLAADLTTIAGGGQVGPITTSLDGGGPHSHTFTIRKPAGVC